MKDGKLLNEYKEICNKFGYNIEKEFDSEPMCNGKYIEIKVKSNNCKFNADFHDNRTLEDSPCCICFTIISIDSVFEMGKNYYS